MSKADLSLKLWLRVLSGFKSRLIDLKFNKYEYSYYFNDPYKSLL